MGLIRYTFETTPEGIPVFKIKRSSTVGYALYVDVWHITPDLNIRHPRAWAIQQQPLLTPKLIVPTKIVYGEIPDGFVEVIPPEPLQIGHYYRFGEKVFQKIAATEFSVLSTREFDSILMAYSIDPFKPEISLARIASANNPDIRPSKKLAHPAAVNLLQDDFYWNSVDTMAPFGTDVGWHVLQDFVIKFEMEPNFDVYTFLQEEFAAVDACALDEWLLAKKHFNLASEVGSTVVIATTFAQLLVQGRISKESREFWAQTFRLESQYKRDKIYLNRLYTMQKAVDAAPV